MNPSLHRTLNIKLLNSIKRRSLVISTFQFNSALYFHFVKVFYVILFFFLFLFVIQLQMASCCFHLWTRWPLQCWWTAYLPPSNANHCWNVSSSKYNILIICHRYSCRHQYDGKFEARNWIGSCKWVARNCNLFHPLYRNAFPIYKKSVTIYCTIVLHSAHSVFI